MRQAGSNFAIATSLTVKALRLSLLKRPFEALKAPRSRDSYLKPVGSLKTQCSASLLWQIFWTDNPK